MNYSDDELQAFLDELGVTDGPPFSLVDDFTPVLHALARIVLEGAPGAGSYLVLDCADFYVQFAGSFCDTNLILEAVSSQYLPSEHELSPHQVQQLLDLGFSAPARAPHEPRSLGSPNFRRTIDVGTEQRLYEAALLAVTILRDIYNCCHDEDIKYVLRIAAWPPGEFVA